MGKSLRYFLALACLIASNTAIAQNLNGAYFLDGFAYGHEMNPAKDYDRKGYFSFPALGNITMGTRGNLGIQDVIYTKPNGDGVTSFLNPHLDVKEVMSNFQKNNKFLFDSRVEILSFGFRAFKGYNTFNLSTRVNAGLKAPYELFDVMKNLQNQDYDVKDFYAQAQGWVEMGFGHSHEVGKAWRVGGKMKILLGAARAEANGNRLQLENTGRNRWTATVDASVETSMKGLTWGETETKRHTPQYMEQHPKEKPTYEQVDFGNLDLDDPGVGGGGVAFDLGAEWDLGKQGLVKGLKISAALLDLGFIKWKNTLTASNHGESFVFRGFDEATISDSDWSDWEEEEWDDVGTRLEDLYPLEAEKTVSKVHAIGATLNVGVEYALPSYDKLSFGLLSTTRMQGKYSWNEERLSVTLSPAKAFEIALSGAVGTLGASVGGVINVHPRGFNLFFGMDHMLGRFSKKGIPQKNNADFTFGINFPIGKSKM